MFSYKAVASSFMDHFPCICCSSFSASLHFFDSRCLGITVPINKAFTHKLCLRLCLQRKLAEVSLKDPQSEILELIQSNYGEAFAGTGYFAALSKNDFVDCVMENTMIGDFTLM